MEYIVPNWSFGPTFDLSFNAAIRIEEVDLPVGWFQKKMRVSDSIVHDVVETVYGSKYLLGVSWIVRESDKSTIICMPPAHCEIIAPNYPYLIDQVDGFRGISNLHRFYSILVGCLIRVTLQPNPTERTPSGANGLLRVLIVSAA